MKTLILTLGALICLRVPAAEPANDPAYKDVKEGLAKQVQRLSQTAEEAAGIMTQEIREKYGYDVYCDRGWWGIWRALPANSCIAGLENLDAALATVPPQLSKESLKTVHIEINRPGIWQGITLKNRDMKIPYNAHPQSMAKFITIQTKEILGLSLSQLEKINQQMSEKIKQKYSVKVVNAPEISFTEYHDGLERANLALQLVFFGATPTEEEIRQLGYDTIVLGLNNQGLYEDAGELRVGLDATAHPGQMFDSLLHAVSPLRGGYTLFRTQIDWTDIEKFRETREKSGELMAALQTKFAPVKIKCSLERTDEFAISMADCREGLEKLNKVVETYGSPTAKADYNELRIGKFHVAVSRKIPEQRALAVSYDSSVDDLHKALFDAR